MGKNVDENFRDWFLEAFGFGYGTGDKYYLKAIKKFLDNCKQDNPESSHSYSYEQMEKIFSKLETWLLINSLCKNDVIEYGSSPRFGWLAEEGQALKKYLEEKNIEQLLEIVTGFDSGDVIHCDRYACNCGPKGYQEGKLCPNPFWYGHH